MTTNCIEIFQGENTAEAVRQAGVAAIHAAVATDAASDAEDARDAAQVAGRYYATRAAGAAAVPTGEMFTSDETGTLAFYKRIADAPNYEFYQNVPTQAQFDEKVAIADLASRTGAEMIGAGSAAGILTDLDTILNHVNGMSYFGIAASGSNAGHRVQDVIDELSHLAGDKGAVLRLKPNTAIDWELDPADPAYREGIRVRPRVELDLQGARITRRCHADNERGFLLMSHASILNGRIDAISEFISVGGSDLGIQAGIHGPIGAGAIYGSGGTVASPSELEGAYSWSARNLTLTADKALEYVDGLGNPHVAGAALIQIYGGCHSFLVDNIYAPSSATAYGVVAADWAHLDDGGFTTDQTAFAANRTAWEAGTLLTTHPANGIINRIFAGDLTKPNTGQDTGTFLVRFSGCQGMQATNMWGGTTTSGLVLLTAGDPGFEFANTRARLLGMDGSVFRNINGYNPQHGYLGYFDSFADNLYRAIAEEGYDAFSDPLVFAGLTIDGLRGFTDRGADALDGIRAIQLWGADIKNSAAIGFRNNILIDERTRAIKVHDNKASLARQSNIYIGHGIAPEDCEIYANDLSLAGRGGGYHAGIYHANAKRTKIYDNTFGVEGTFDDSTTWGIRLDGGEGIQGWGNKHRSTKSDGVAESVFSADDHGKVDSWRIGEMLDPAFINIAYSGQQILPVERRTDQDLVRRGRYRAPRAVLTGDTTPTAGNWLKGERIDYLETDAGGYGGVACTTSGTVAAALAGVTASITSGTKDLTVSSSAALTVGQFIAIAGVTGAKRIVAINNTAVTIDSNADATVSGAAVTFSAPVFKRTTAVEA